MPLRILMLLPHCASAPNSQYTVGFCKKRLSPRLPMDPDVAARDPSLGSI
jgi:hypothetical protein